MRHSSRRLVDVSPAGEKTLRAFLERTYRPEAAVPPKPGVELRYIGDIPVCPPGDACWVWGGAMRHGRPYFNGQYGFTPAARWAYIFINPKSGWEAADPEERWSTAVMTMKCGNEDCVNPKHVSGKTPHQLAMERIEARKEKQEVTEARDTLLGRPPQAGPWGPRASGVLRLDKAGQNKVMVRIHNKCVVTGDGCLVWRGALVGSRPTILLAGRLVGCARVLWELKNGKPCEVVLRDGCGTAGCVNPDHKRAVTPVEAARVSDEVAIATMRERLGIADAHERPPVPMHWRPEEEYIPGREPSAEQAKEDAITAALLTGKPAPETPETPEAAAPDTSVDDGVL